MGVRSQVDQECRVCIEPRKMYSCGHWINFRNTNLLEAKADSLDTLEGNRPGHATESVQVTTGVLDQVMCLRG